MKNKIIEMLPTRLYLEYRFRDYKRVNKSWFNSRQLMRTCINDQGYSYKPFDESKAIFIHVPKCAGVSLSDTLFGCLAGGHTTLDEYLNIFEPHNIQKYFKFTVVRNPWDRLVSAYFFLQKGGFNQKDKTWFEEELSDYSTFEEFVKAWVNKENIMKWHHFRPQVHYILNKHNKVKLDFIGYLENLDSDFDIIKSKVGSNITLQGLNKGQHNAYMDYYTDETKAIVSRVYEEDIKYLGYNFDNSSLSEQIAKRKNP